MLHQRRPSIPATARLLAAVVLTAGPARAQCAETSLESLAPGGGPANGESVLPLVSGDGRFVVFLSTADNLVAGDTPGTLDLFRRESTTGQVERLNVSTAGKVSPATAISTSMSRDGRYVVFSSAGKDLVPGDTNKLSDVFVRDVELGLTTRVSVGDTGQQGNLPADQHGISPDGRYVAFSSRSENLVPGDSNDRFDVFLRDLSAGTLLLVSVSSGGAQGDAASTNPSVSLDGSFVAFSSASTTLVPGDTNGASDVFVHEVASGVTTRVSVATNGQQGDGGSTQPEITPDGRFVVFTSAATNLVPSDTNGVEDVFVHDRLTGETTRASLGDAGQEGNGRSYGAFAPHLSDDGRYVVFASEADNLVPGDTNGIRDTFHRDRLSGVVRRVSVHSNGAQDDGGALGLGGNVGGLSADGSSVVFNAWGEGLVDGDTNGTQDVYRHRVWTAPESYCVSFPNSTGAAAEISSLGDPSIAHGGLTLVATPVPNQFGLFFFGGSQTQVPLGNGVRCAGVPLHRLPPVNAQGGRLEHALDYGAPPASGILPGSTWNFQAWYRDPAGGGSGFNTSDGLSVTFCR